MKKLSLSLLLSLLVFCAYAEGISNYKELLAFAKAANAGEDISSWLNEKKVLCLKADIDMKKGKKFPSIEKLTVVFDGCGHKLYNWKTKVSLFTRIDAKGEVRNLVIDESCHLSVRTSFNESTEYVSFISNINRGKIINCVNNGAITHVGDEANKVIYIGSMAALNLNIVHNCKNTGDITSNFNYTRHVKGMSLRIGGLVGTCYGKQLAGATISCCENTGNISYAGDYPSTNIAGIVGESSRLPVRSCVNRGTVAAQGLPINTPGISGGIRIGGITGWGNNDISNCDNFGIVSALGAHTTDIGGICARPNMTLNMVGCNNYGDIVSNTSKMASIGGLAGKIEVNIYVSNCYNYGNVQCNGTERQGWCGGIAGVILLRSGVKKGPVFRDCVNYGAVTNKSTYASTSTGGIIGYGAGRADKKAPVVKVKVQDCANYGKITSADKHTADIVGTAKHLDVLGQRYDDCAKPVKLMSNGSNIYGRVVDNNDMPVVNAVVSDGLQSVVTDINGEYNMKSDMGNARFVTLSVPAGYEMPLRNNRPQFFRRVPRNVDAVRADFVIKKRENPTDKFILAMVGDPHTRGWKSDKAAERYKDKILADIAKLQQAEADKEVYAINLGDLVDGSMVHYEDYIDLIGKATLPVFSVIGNYDFGVTTLFDTYLGTAFFESHLAPLNYSFNIGKIHFVVLNTINYSSGNVKTKYKTGLDAKTCTWLESDLKHVPKESTIVICGHAPLFKQRASEGDKNLNFKRYSNLLAQYNKVYVWAGHTPHQNFSYNYATETTKYPNLKNIETIVVARALGQLYLNREMNTDGTPNGYMVAEVDGDKLSWYYKSVGYDRDYQMRAYSPVDTNSDYVKVNIWNHSPNTWSTPEWWENGVKVADMVCTGKEYDPGYLKIYARHNQEKLSNANRTLSRPAKVPFLFRVVPTAGIRSGEVRVTDNFGKTYIQKVEW